MRASQQLRPFMASGSGTYVQCASIDRHWMILRGFADEVSRVQREMIAVVVSAVNKCHY